MENQTMSRALAKEIAEKVKHQNPIDEVKPVKRKNKSVGRPPRTVPVHRTNLYIPEDVYQDLVQTVENTGHTISGFVTHAIKHCIKHTKKG